MNAIWYSWDDHRRSRELSRELDIPFEVIRRSKIPVLGNLITMVRTARLLLNTKAKTVITQNPSLLLTTVACLVKKRAGFRLVQDLHSYFEYHIIKGVGFRGKVYRLLSLFCIRHADLTVITNPPLKSLIETLGGRGFVLQDLIPTFPPRNGHRLSQERKIVYVCTYSEDEPVTEVFEAGRLLNGETTIHVTGRIPARMRAWPVPAGIKLTDFLPESEYLDLLASADAVMALTIREYTLLCGAYEGLAFQKPLILSDMMALKDYFGDKMIYVDNKAAAIADGIRKLYSAKPFFDRHAAELALNLAHDWPKRFEDFRTFVLGQETREPVTA